MGKYTPDRPSNSTPVPIYVATKAVTEEPLSDALTKFWQVEEPTKPISILTPEELKFQDHYNDTHTFSPHAGRYIVTLPKKDTSLKLGESRSRALTRYQRNEASLLRRGTWTQFQAVVQEYLTLGHAQLVTSQELNTPVQDSYYLPMHGVHKDSSSTTKLRVVFDGSAPSYTGVSLNDLLAVGPTLHPTLDRILLKFRTYRVALTGDISKMYREVMLSPPDRQLHRFLWRPQPDQPVLDYCMNWVTFGVASSPYLAVRTLQQTATDFCKDSAIASWHVTQSFYVNDLLAGADIVAQAVELFRDLREMLSKGGIDLKKWRSNSSEVLKAIPPDLQEPISTQDLVDSHSAQYPKALGITWDSKKDIMSTHVQLPSYFASTKRGVISDVAKTFDVLGWIAPVILWCSNSCGS